MNILSYSNIAFMSISDIRNTLSNTSNEVYVSFDATLDTISNNVYITNPVALNTLSNESRTFFQGTIDGISNYTFTTGVNDIAYVSNLAYVTLVDDYETQSNFVYGLEDRYITLSNDYNVSNLATGDYDTASNTSYVTLDAEIDYLSNLAFNNDIDIDTLSNDHYPNLNSNSVNINDLSNYSHTTASTNVSDTQVDVDLHSNYIYGRHNPVSNELYNGATVDLSNEVYSNIPVDIDLLCNFVYTGGSPWERSPIINSIETPATVQETEEWYSCNNVLDYDYAGLSVVAYDYTGSGTINVTDRQPHFSGVENTSGNYAYKFRVAWPFGKSIEKNVSLTVDPLVLGKDKIFGKLSDLRMGSYVSSKWYSDFRLYPGCVVLSNSSYYLDRNSNISDYSSNYAFAYTASGNGLMTIVLDADGSNDRLSLYTNVTSIDHGVDMGGAGTLLGESDNRQAAYDSSVRGYHVPVGGHVNTSLYTTKYLQINPTNSDLDNMCSQDSDWSYGFRLTDTWMAGRMANQLLAPAGSNFFINSIYAYNISTSDYEYLAYGNDTGGPYRTSTGTSWHIDFDDNFIIGEAGELVTITYNGTSRSYKVYVDNVLKVSTTSSVYIYMSDTTTSPILRFGDISDVNGYTSVLGDQDEVGSWPYSLDSLFIANGTEFDASAVADLVTNKADLTGATNYSSITTLIEFGETSTTVTKGHVTIGRGTTFDGSDTSYGNVTSHSYSMTRDTVFGSLSDIQGNFYVSGDTRYNNFIPYQGAVVESNDDNYYIDRSGSIQSEASNCMLMFESGESNLFAFIIDSNDSVTSINLIGNVSNVTHGQQVTSGSTFLTNGSLESAAIASSVRGLRAPGGGYHNSGYSGTKYLQIASSDSSLDGVLSRNNAWSYGFVLLDDWVAAGSYNQMLSGIDSNFSIQSTLAYNTGSSEYEYHTYGDTDDGPSRQSGIGTGWNIGTSGYKIASSGKTVIVTYNNSNDEWKLYADGELLIDINDASYMTNMLPATHTNPTLRFGDFSYANGVTDHPIDYNRIGGWYARMDSLFIANKTALTSVQVNEINTDSNDISVSDNHSLFTTLIKFSSSNTMLVKGTQVLSVGDVTF